jgi:hypothetical protein
MPFLPFAVERLGIMIFFQSFNVSSESDGGRLRWRREPSITGDRIGSRRVIRS